MSSVKYIYKTGLPTGNKTIYCHLHYLIGYCPATIKEYREMAKELRKTFPNIKDDDIECRVVRKSIRYYGFTLIIARAKLTNKLIKNAEKDGWCVIEHDSTHDVIEYYW